LSDDPALLDQVGDRRERRAVETIGIRRVIEAEIRRLGLEGVVAKRSDSLYVPGQRSDAWVKVKFSPQQEFVVGGYNTRNIGEETALFGPLFVPFFTPSESARVRRYLPAGLLPQVDDVSRRYARVELRGVAR
jgi:hypothetical protein